jgi:hypothetical protein
MFKLFGSRVLDAEEEAGLLGHLNNEAEFLSAYGLHSMSKTDIAYDPADIDNGGPGSYTGFPPNIAERLYKAGHADAAENILKRIRWWGERLPYWGNSFTADRIDYRRDMSQQCNISGAAAAQCILFGMFGVRAELNGDIRIDPRPPAFTRRIELRGLRLLGRTVDIFVEDGEYRVHADGKSIRRRVGDPFVLKSGSRTKGEDR